MIDLQVKALVKKFGGKIEIDGDYIIIYIPMKYENMIYNVIPEFLDDKVIIKDISEYENGYKGNT